MMVSWIRDIRIALVGCAVIGWTGYLIGWLLKWMVEN
jgi:hypothetical protein